MAPEDLEAGRTSSRGTESAIITMFSTEFPLRYTPSSAEFAAQVIGWLRGMKRSTVLNDYNENDFDETASTLKSHSGEEIRFRSIIEDDMYKAIGFRHDIPDNEGRLWRTEAVLLRNSSPPNQNIIRLRTQCLARQSDASLQTPKKPYLIKLILDDKWGGNDGLLEVTASPLLLKDDENSIELGKHIVSGSASNKLPIIYFSMNNEGRFALGIESIKKLAFQLGGVAHVVAEPSRAYSFQLRDANEGDNVYGGTIGIFTPNRGLIQRIIPSVAHSDSHKIFKLTQELASLLRTHMPAEGWDWTELQEQALRRQRESQRAQLTANQSTALYEEEIENLKDQIQQLKDQAIQSDSLVKSKDIFGGQEFDSIQAICPEIYPGEIYDKLRIASSVSLRNAESIGMDRRPLYIIGLISQLPESIGLHEMRESLKMASKDKNRAADLISNLLSRHGYTTKSQNKHIKLDPKIGFEGLEIITISKTPSDTRGLKNMQKQIERTIGLSKF